MAVAADVVALREMPILADFLIDKSEELRDLAVDAIVKFAAARALAGTIAATGAKVGGLGANEMVEGLDRLAVAEAAAQRSEDLAAAGVGYAVAGIVELEVAKAAGEAARGLAVEGVAQVAAGAVELGEGATLEAVGEALAEKAM